VVNAGNGIPLVTRFASAAASEPFTTVWKVNSDNDPERPGKCFLMYPEDSQRQNDGWISCENPRLET
jgi:hypothetical protein